MMLRVSLVCLLLYLHFFLSKNIACPFITCFSVNLPVCFFLHRHAFSEDTWVKFSNLSEEKIIGTYDTTAHVSKLSPFFPLRVKAHPRYQRSLLFVPRAREGPKQENPGNEAG